MIESITGKGEIKAHVQQIIEQYEQGGIEALSLELQKTILNAKVRFPLLEFTAELLFDAMRPKEQLSLCHKISKEGSIGGNVIIGIVLQKRMTTDLEESFDHASKIISKGGQWYVSDIIGERVFGVGLLQGFESALRELEILKDHEDPWVVRAIGPGVHYATKKGLEKGKVKRAFKLLLELRSSKQPMVKSGIGWAAKTVAKFHPDIIKENAEIIFEDKGTGAWFIRKVRIGLERNAYAKGG